MCVCLINIIVHYSTDDILSNSCVKLIVLIVHVSPYRDPPLYVCCISFLIKTLHYTVCTCVLLLVMCLLIKTLHYTVCVVLLVVCLLIKILHYTVCCTVSNMSPYKDTSLHSLCYLRKMSLHSMLCRLH